MGAGLPETGRTFRAGPGECRIPIAMKSFPATAVPDRTPAEALRAAFDLYEFGENVMRQNLRREHPGADEAEIELLIREWLLKRPGAEEGDASGRACRRAAFEL